MPEITFGSARKIIFWGGDFFLRSICEESDLLRAQSQVDDQVSVQCENTL